VTEAIAPSMLREMLSVMAAMTKVTPLRLAPT
jgi:hypothetical protein